MKQSKHNFKLTKIITFPVRVLSKARDLYVKSMNSYADLACYGAGAGGLGFSGVEPYHLNFGTNSLRPNADSDDLIRAASLNQINRRPNFQIDKSASANVSVWRSASVGMEKIDEE